MEMSAVDAGARFAYERPVGAFDAGTHAADTTFGGAAFALDATGRLSSMFSIGGLLLWAPTVPTLCDSFDNCKSSVGSDVEIDALARFRAPRWRFVEPDFEIGFGWSWSSRSLADDEATSTRRWNGPVLVRVAVIPTLRLGERTRLGFVLGGSLARSASYELEAPGVSRHGIEGARLHGTLDFGLRFGLDLW